jgi:hypothetical protein
VGTIFFAFKELRIGESWLWFVRAPDANLRPGDRRKAVADTTIAILSDILKEVSKGKMVMDYSPGLAQIRRAVILAGLAASPHVPAGIAQKAAKALVDAAETLKVFES